MKQFTVKLLVLGLLTLQFLTGCQRDSIMPELERPSRGDTNEDLLKDSVYIYTYFFYLWQDELPDQFPTRNYNSADAVLEALKGYARNDKGDPYDRFSFLDRTGTVDAEVQQGLSGSFGFDVRYQNDTDLYVKKVDLQSPAYTAGIRRGWKVLAINGNGNLSLASMEQDNYAFLYGALDGTVIDLKLQKPDGESVTVSLRRQSYRIQPILAHRIYTAGTKKVGYFAFDIFVSTLDFNNASTYVKTQLDQLMSQFEAAGIDELIVDLRYNGGGAVVTADYLANLLAPPAVGNGLMYSYKLNDELVKGGWQKDVFPTQYFDKPNGLQLDRIYFLVTEGTASASELLINTLEPHIDVKLIGENRTYGKPVGNFAWDIMNVDLYAVSFQTFNSEGYGDYFSGFPVDRVAYDDLTRDFGDPKEAMIAEALHYAETGNFTATARNLQLNNRQIGGGMASRSNLNQVLDRHGNKGMYRFDRKAIQHK
ncbi:S41 family peptidase [Parapedobacter lycopersici]|uniref:S41 family peptidase n=1 Tax=Parapedobacter lycopersici TaxID=1864939 RepID=UPI00214D2C6A|nr:S41 family peptidase [Parapedobacter lycopersici]